MMRCTFTGRSLPPEVATSERPAISPSGEYVLVIVSGYDGVARFQSFQIVRRHAAATGERSALLGETVYAALERFASRHTTYFLWGPGDRVWVYSGDVGTFFWERNAETGLWEKHGWAAEHAPLPEFLQQRLGEG
ncbi:MAG: hypothetical protein N2508_16650 [Anaerolineae bacterium]|nr:hypothetical protein [Anaerolineae bacterium]